jgi:hypothetical protein
MNAERLVLVGNGTPDRDVSSFVDNCEHVVRFNAMYNYFGGYVGTKFTIFCPVSDVLPRKVDKKDQVPFIFELAGRPEELWLPRPCGFQAVRSNKRRAIRTGRDFGKQHIKHWGFEKGKYRYISSGLFNELTLLIRQLRPEDDPLVPSTGMVGIYWAMNQRRFSKWDIYVVGFPLSRLWRGHSKGAERQLLKQWIADGKVQHV